MSFFTLILCPTHSKLLTLVFHTWYLVPQKVFSKKLQWTLTSFADGPRFFEHGQPTIYWLTAKVKEGLFSVLPARELQVSLSIWKKQSLRESYGKGRQPCGSPLSAAC